MFLKPTVHTRLESNCALGNSREGDGSEFLSEALRATIFRTNQWNSESKISTYLTETHETAKDFIPRMSIRRDT